MIRRRENIKLFIGFLIVVSIFVFIGVTSYIDKINAFDNIINYEDKFSSSVPFNYSEEVIDINQIGGNNTKIDKSENVVGFSLAKSPTESFNLVKSQLLDKGWKFVESGSSSSASFYKDEGKYKWLFVNCVNVGGETSIVLTSN